MRCVHRFLLPAGETIKGKIRKAEWEKERTSSPGYNQLCVPYGPPRHRKAEAMLKHGRDLPARKSLRFLCTASLRAGTPTIAHLVVLWQVLQVTCLHPNKI